MLEIRKNVPKPENIKVSHSTATKYPLAQMELGDFFVVPKSDMQQDDDPAKFRNRIQKSVKNYVLRTMTNDVRQEYTVALLQEDDKGDNPQFLAGDVGVWRDK